MIVNFIFTMYARSVHGHFFNLSKCIQFESRSKLALNCHTFEPENARKILAHRDEDDEGNFPVSIYLIFLLQPPDNLLAFKQKFGS